MIALGRKRQEWRSHAEGSFANQFDEGMALFWLDVGYHLPVWRRW
jgi:hypothetical protein